MSAAPEPSVIVSPRASVTNVELWQKIDSLQRTVTASMKQRAAFPRWATAVLVSMALSHAGTFLALYWLYRLVHRAS